MKTFISILLALVMVLGFINGVVEAESTKKINIVTTTFPIYDWTRNIVGDNDNYNIVMLLDNGIDLHSYQPSVDDIVRIGSADLFIYTGGISDTWAKDAIHNAVNKDIKSLNLVETLGDMAKNEKIVEGMQDSHHKHEHDEHEHDEHEHDEHEHDEHEHEEHEHDEHEHEEHEHEEHEHEEHEREEHEHSEHNHVDEHVWLSLENAEIICRAIKDKLCEIDSANAEIFTDNFVKYSDQLNALSDEFEMAIDNSPNKTLLFADRFPFRYLADDYGIKYYAAFSGCSAETEASFETVSFLANKLDELKLKNVITIDGRTHRIAETVIETSKSKDQSILVLDSMQSITVDAVEAGASYLSIMKNNLEVLKQALQ